VACSYILAGTLAVWAFATGADESRYTKKMRPINNFDKMRNWYFLQ